MSYFTSVLMATGDSPTVDAAARIRVSQPHMVFDAQLTYGLQTLLYEQIVSGSGAAITHSPTERWGLISFASSPAGSQAMMQTFEHFRYQPSKSQLILSTFNFIEAVPGVTKFIGYSDGINGFEFQLVGTVKRWAALSATSLGNIFVDQANWNLDRLDGSHSQFNKSGVNLDIAKTQLIVIDAQALYVGRVRVGFVIGTEIIYCHEFLHANIAGFPYMQDANLPVRCGMTASATVSTTMAMICCSITSEGGVEDICSGFQFAIEGTAVLPSGSPPVHMLSIRPRMLLGGFVNRTLFTLESIDLISDSKDILWQLCLGQAISGNMAFLPVNTQSAFEYNVLGVASGAPQIVALNGYCPAQDALKAIQTAKLKFRYPICLDAAGLARPLGTLSVTATRTDTGGTTRVRAALGWKEVR